MVYITGDTHGHFDRIRDFCDKMETTKQDTMIILGDAGFNFWLNKTDRNNKRNQQNLPIKFFCIHGNHEVRPQNIASYVLSEYWGGKVYIEPEYPDIMFAVDGEVYDIPTSKGLKKAMVIGGAYSVDKYYRMVRYIANHRGIYQDEFINRAVDYVRFGVGNDTILQELDEVYERDNLANKCAWWSDEQPSEATKIAVENRLNDHDWSMDIILSHTCPLKYEPVEVFLSGIDQSKVDKSTEKWLGKLEARLQYEKWYCGHYHTDKKIDKLELMFESIDML